MPVLRRRDQGVAIKCRYCGEMLNAAPARRGTSAPTPPQQQTTAVPPMRRKQMAIQRNNLDIEKLKKVLEKAA